MWRLLTQAGIGIATFKLGQRIAQLQRVAAFGAVAGVIGLLGLGALTAAAAIWLTPRLGPAGAAASVGGGLLVLAAVIGWAGTWKRRPKTPAPLFDRVRSEVGAAGSAIAASRATRSAKSASKSAARSAADSVHEDELPLPPSPGAKRKRALNMVLFATLAGVVLGRRL